MIIPTKNSKETIKLANEENKMKNNKILVTGGCGFIGTNLVKYLAENTNWEIIILDNLSSGKKEYIENISDTKINLIQGDIRNKKDVKKAISDCDYVVNLAAQVGVIPSIKNPLLDMDVNVKGTINLLEESVKNNVKRFVQASSAAPLGKQEMPLNETKIPRPLSPYGASKLAGEGYCSAFSGSYNLSTVVLRFSNVYGIYSDMKGSVIPLFIRQILDKKTLTIYGDGKQTRDFIYVSDICQGIFLGLTQDLNKSSLFQLGTGQETSIKKLVEYLKEIFSKDISFDYATQREGEIYQNYTSIEKAKKELGFKPEISLKKGLEKTIEWFKDYY